MRIIGKRTRGEKTRGRKWSSPSWAGETIGRGVSGEERWHNLLASFLGVLSLTTIQFAFHPINRASRRTFVGIHDVFSREFFISSPLDAARTYRKFLRYSPSDLANVVSSPLSCGRIDEITALCCLFTESN